MGALRGCCAHAFSHLTWAEVSGSLGDLGTFLPLLIGLVQKVNLDLGTTLIVTGIYNLVSGLQFRIPMCVQPMKTIAAVALAASQPALTLSQLLHAGLFVAGCELLLGATRLVDVVNRLVPASVIRGVQLAVGVKLAMKGIDMALRIHVTAAAAAGTAGAASSSGSSGSEVRWRPWLGPDGLIVGATALLLLFVSTIPTREPQQQLEQQRPQRYKKQRVQRQTQEHASTVGGQEGDTEGAAAAAAGGSGSGCGGSCSRNGRPSDATTTTLIDETSRLFQLATDDGDGRSAAAAVAATGTTITDLEAAPSSRRPEQVGSTSGSSNGSAAGGGGGGGGSNVQDSSSSSSGCCKSRPAPTALLVVVVGLMLTVVSRPGLLAELRLGPSTPRLLHPSWPDLREGALRAGLPQLPLTTLNSVIAVTQLATCLFPDRPSDAPRWRPSSVALSVGLLNLFGCWLGALPCCHGAGGLAAQYKFGARTGAAPILLGCLKAALGLLFGGSLAALLQSFPQPLLGALLTLSGVELAASVRHTRSARGYSYALLTAAAILALDNTGTGFLIGLAAAAAVAAHETLAEAAIVRQVLYGWRHW
ncbi:hypothetical protein Agub_g2377, partial [Astrephomene gubernaculifera]